MAYKGLRQFVDHLREQDDLLTINEYVDPMLEIAEMADRFVKSNGKALLFRNTGTSFPLLINMFASDKRMSMAIGRESLEDAGMEIEKLFRKISTPAERMIDKLRILPCLSKIASYMPTRIRGKGACQKIIITKPDLDDLPVLKCWPHDGGRFITLPIVHTRHPETGDVNAGMYRMQIMNKKTTGMHWHMHKTGANHFEAWKKRGERMPVSVVLGGDPVYTYSATAPLPEGIDEYILAGFLRKKRVKMVKCITNDLYVPEDSDIVIEGYVDPSEQSLKEGPFGDHTGFYSLADWYPAFHVTCITHRQDAVYPTTIVGVPPMEDAWIGKATEKLFLAPIKLTMQREITDIHMPDAGVAHNLVLVKIKKNYPGQGMKVINSLFGAGQMMFSKFIVVVSDNVNIRDYKEVTGRIFSNTDINTDMFISKGPLDVLDHSSDNFSFGGKMGIDATEKFKEESDNNNNISGLKTESLLFVFKPVKDKVRLKMPSTDLPVVFAGISKDTIKFNDLLELNYIISGLVLIVVDSTVDMEDSFILLWQVLSNTDPSRDLKVINGNVIIDSTSKTHPSDNFKRQWPNIVMSDDKTIRRIDSIMNIVNSGNIIKSPSSRLKKLDYGGGASAGMD
ncbi:MAG TPA: menaquinone biosynthesis decarboxylase [Bacteroidales bacterium]|nr:menaquinone biosynthesis decarboxylase [Bacteroidales bacterium]